MNPSEWRVDVERVAGEPFWSERLRETFTMWKTAWDDVFRAKDPGYSHPSDGFSRQDEIVCVSHLGRVVGMVAHRYVNTSRPDLSSDSFFSYWPAELKTSVLKPGRKLVIGSQITIAPEGRSSRLGVDLKMVISGLSLARVWASGPDVVVGMMRVDKGMNKVFESMGAEVLGAPINYHGMEGRCVQFVNQPNLAKVGANERGLILALQMPQSSLAIRRMDATNQWRAV
jgi:hypothetical protein